MHKNHSHYQKINFRENFNNKLVCKYFTTVRESSNYKYLVGSIFKIYINRVFVKCALLLKVEKVDINTLDEVFCYYDAGICKAEFLSVFEDFYSKHGVVENDFVLLLFKTVHDNLKE